MVECRARRVTFDYLNVTPLTIEFQYDSTQMTFANKKQRMGAYRAYAVYLFFFNGKCRLQKNAPTSYSQLCSQP